MPATTKLDKGHRSIPTPLYKNPPGSMLRYTLRAEKRIEMCDISIPLLKGYCAMAAEECRVLDMASSTDGCHSNQMPM
jgi:hypothetical protein